MIDMGGGSVQIAFEVTNEEQMQKIPSQMIAEFNLGCQEADVEHTYRVYVTTFLGYGANSAIDRYQAALARNATSASKARRADMSRVPSMSYFMTEENQMEQGVRYIKGNGYL
nr:hypothetical protein BaRGS_018458 [Batillaria attramentaria]